MLMMLGFEEVVKGLFLSGDSCGLPVVNPW